ncbi:MAG: hypothetical protein EOO09_10920 [Chitinophagaceae bacterium]|nr:MAG: hypothetical protein EOO09_10920 [Chitinophagaceae bacterium]
MIESNMKRFISPILLTALVALLLPAASLYAQDKEVLQSVSEDTTVTVVVDTSTGEVKKKFVYSPRTAAIRSAILPGLGQIYNKKYWKLPIVYGALGVSGGVFVFNLKWYQRTRFAVRVVSDASITDYEAAGVHKDLLNLANRKDITTLSYARDEYRRSIDYSAIFFVLLWGLNVVDATVDAHLKGFDVSPDLSFKFKPGFSEMAGTAGMNLVLEIGKKKPALLASHF